MKLGAHVILLTNLDLDAEGDQKLANGSRGIVVRWADAAEVKEEIERREREREEKLQGTTMQGWNTGSKSQSDLKSDIGSDQKDDALPNEIGSRDDLTANKHYYDILKAHLLPFVDRHAKEGHGLPVS
jgi:hypothetical protein